MDAPTLLIVEKDRAVAESMAHHFEPKGYRVLHSRDGLEAVRKIAEELPSVVVMGLTSPRLGGLDTVRRIRRAYPTISIVFAAPPEDDPRYPPRSAFTAGSPDWRSLDRLVARATAGEQGSRTSQAVPAAGAIGTEEAAGARVMVVDDMAEIRQLLTDYLESEGYTVEAVGTGTEALLRLTAFRPRVILLDLLMPGLSGLSALQQIRARDPEVGVIMVTGDGNEELAKQTLALGAFDYVRKPINFAYLKQSLETFLSMRALLPQTERG